MTGSPTDPEELDAEKLAAESKYKISIFAACANMDDSNKWNEQKDLIKSVAVYEGDGRWRVDLDPEDHERTIRSLRVLIKAARTYGSRVWPRSWAGPTGQSLKFPDLYPYTDDEKLSDS